MALDSLLESIKAAGITLTAEAAGIRAEPRAALTNTLRAEIRANRAAILESLEIKAHLVRLLPGEDHPDFAEAYAHAISYPGALECLRATPGREDA